MSAAYILAESLFEKGISLMKTIQESWIKYQSLVFNLYIELSECLFWGDKIEEAEKYFQEAINHLDSSTNIFFIFFLIK